MTNIEQIRQILKHSGYKLQYVALVLDISPSTLRGRLNGTSDFRVSEAEKLAALLRLTREEREKYFFGSPRSAAKLASSPERGAANDA